LEGFCSLLLTTSGLDIGKFEQAAPQQKSHADLFLTHYLNTTRNITATGTALKVIGFHSSVAINSMR
jgi:hypothetical protein